MFLNDFDKIFALFSSVKIFNKKLEAFSSYIIAGIDHVIDRARSTGRRSVISMPFVGPITPAVNDAIREAVTNNIVVVTAAGDTHQDACDFSPSNSPDVVTVGAIQEAKDPDFEHLVRDRNCVGFTNALDLVVLVGHKCSLKYFYRALHGRDQSEKGALLFIKHTFLPTVLYCPQRVL